MLSIDLIEKSGATINDDLLLQALKLTIPYMLPIVQYLIDEGKLTVTKQHLSLLINYSNWGDDCGAYLKVKIAARSEQAVSSLPKRPS